MSPGSPQILICGESGGNGRPQAAEQIAIATHLPNASAKVGEKNETQKKGAKKVQKVQKKCKESAKL